jgi:hypothetical protein
MIITWHIQDWALATRGGGGFPPGKGRGYSQLFPVEVGVSLRNKPAPNENAGSPGHGVEPLASAPSLHVVQQENKDSITYIGRCGMLAVAASLQESFPVVNTV